MIYDIGCTQLATEVDDIIPVSVSAISRADADDDTLQAVCHYCHHRKTERERLKGLAASNERRQSTQAPTRQAHSRRRLTMQTATQGGIDLREGACRSMAATGSRNGC